MCIDPEQMCRGPCACLRQSRRPLPIEPRPGLHALALALHHSARREHGPTLRFNGQRRCREHLSQLKTRRRQRHRIRIRRRVRRPCRPRRPARAGAHALLRPWARDADAAVVPARERPLRKPRSLRKRDAAQDARPRWNFQNPRRDCPNLCWDYLGARTGREPIGGPRDPGRELGCDSRDSGRADVCPNPFAPAGCANSRASESSSKFTSIDGRRAELVRCSLAGAGLGVERGRLTGCGADTTVLNDGGMTRGSRNDVPGMLATTPGRSTVRSTSRTVT